MLRNFVPILPIQPSEYKRRIYLDNFVKVFKELTKDIHSDLPNFTKIIILKDYQYVAASFAAYLGSNGGLDFLCQCENDYNKVKGSRPHSYLMTWWKYNTRLAWKNNGYRTIEYILADPSYYGFGGQLKNFRPDNLSVTQYELIEEIVEWLGTSAGQLYLLKCEQEILHAKFDDEEVVTILRG